jgi:hypothetical protein
MRIITAPEEYIPENGDIKIFLAGGITDCPNWQQDVINFIKQELIDESPKQELVLFNPRRDNFDIKKDSPKQQIEWEFKHLTNMDGFSMFFSKGESLQPICLYELGRYFSRMNFLYKSDWPYRIAVTVETGYKRSQDVYYQLINDIIYENTLNLFYKQVDNDATRIHAGAIIKLYKYLRKVNFR